MKPHHRICAALACVVVLVPTISAGSEFSLGEISKAAEQIISPLAAEREAGEAWLAEYGDEAFPLLIKQIEESETKDRVAATRAALIFISPWQRGIVAGEKTRGQIRLFRPRRTTARAFDHPQAKAIRQAALVGLRMTLARVPHKATDEDGKTPAFPGWQHRDSVSALCDCLAEVGDDQVSDVLVKLLKEEPSRYYAAAMIGCLETIHGLPVSYQVHGICGNCTIEEIRQYEKTEVVRCNAARDVLLAWIETHGKKSPAERIEAALDVWDVELLTDTCASHFLTNGEWATQRYLTPLIRLGPDAVEPLRKRQASSKSVKSKGIYEVVTAAITGEVDAEFVDQLLGERIQGSSIQYYLACEIIAASDSKDWLAKLDQLQKENFSLEKKAARAMAVVYRTEALPVLRHARKSNYVAECAVKELEAWGE